jgi:hypothetical protein
VGALNQALDKFNNVFGEIADPKKTVTFLQNLLQAAEQVPVLKAQLQDGEFLDALVQLGLTAARLDMAAASGAEPLWFFLDTLWNATSPGEVRLGAQQLGEFLKQANTSEKRLELVRFQEKLLQMLTKVPSDWEELHQPTFINGMMNVGADFVGEQFSGTEIEVDPTGVFIGIRNSSTAQELATVATVFNSFVPTSFDPNKDKSLPSSSDGGTAPLDEAVLYAVLRSPTPPSDPNGRRCFNLIQEIISLGQELVNRYEDMRVDKWDLYILRNDTSDPVPPGQPDRGSWQGHKDFYDSVRRELQKKLDEFRSRGCDDDDPNGYGGSAWDDLFRTAQEYAGKDSPDKPDPKPFTVPDWALAEGVKFIDGVLNIPRTIAIGVLIFLMLLINAFGLNWQFV